MEGNSVEILYRSPGSLSAWLAPETVLWVVLLALAPLAIVWLLWRMVGPSFRAWADRNAATPKEDYRAECAAKAYAHAGYQRTMVAVAYAALLMAAAGVGVSKLGLYNDDRTSMYVNTGPGLPAATALLLPPAIGLMVAGFVASLAAPTYGAAVTEAGLLPVIWCFTGAVGCGFAAFMSAIAGAELALVFAALGVVLLLAGLRLRFSRRAEGRTVDEQARAAERVLQRTYVDREVTQVDVSGEYRGGDARLFWGRIIGTGLMPPLFFGGFFAFTGGLGPKASLSDLLSFVAFACGAGLLFGLLVWAFAKGRARRVVWDQQGLEVQWYAGQPKHFTWDQLTSLKQIQTDDHRSGALVYTALGNKFTIGTGYAGYQELLAALEAHIWRRWEL